MDWISDELRHARELAETARQKDYVAGAMFGGHASTAQHKALAEAVDILAKVCDTLLSRISNLENERNNDKPLLRR